MKAHISYADARQEQLQNVIANFCPDSTCSFLMARHYIMDWMALSDEDATAEEDEKTGEIIAEIVADFALHSCVFAAKEFTDGETDKIEFEGSIEEFKTEFMMAVAFQMARLFEHDFIDFSDVTGMSRADFEANVAKRMAEIEDSGDLVSKFFSPDDE